MVYLLMSFTEKEKAVELVINSENTIPVIPVFDQDIEKVLDVEGLFLDNFWRPFIILSKEEFYIPISGKPELEFSEVRGLLEDLKEKIHKDFLVFAKKRKTRCFAQRCNTYRKEWDIQA